MAGSGDQSSEHQVPLRQYLLTTLLTVMFLCALCSMEITAQMKLMKKCEINCSLLVSIPSLAITLSVTLIHIS